MPFLSLFLLRESRSVNVATFHAYAGFSPSYELGSRADARLRRPAARPDRGQRGGASLHRPLLPGRLQGHPQRRRRRRASRTPCPFARWQDGTPNVLFVGRHEPRKGLLDLLKAHRILRKTGYDDRLLWSAPGRRSARPGATSPRAACRASSSSGASRDAEKAQLFRTADVFVSPATGGESFGIVLLEAMAAGAPIVASDIHGYKGVVRRGREGLLVPPHDPRELAAAIGRLLDDPALRAEMSAAGRERAEAFSWPTVTAKVEDYYGFVIRRLAASGSLPPDFRAPIPQAPPLRARPSSARPRAGAGGPRPPPPRLGQREPPDPGRVGDDEAGHGQGDRQDDQVGREDRASPRSDRPVLTGNWNAYR